jgi:hypothetical protein
MSARALLCPVIAFLVAAAAVGAYGQAQPPATGGKIICWHDKNGKTLGCGDKVPPEYQDNATRELNKRGVTIQRSGPAPTAEQKRAEQAALERKQAEEQQLQEQRRRDKALLDTYTDEKEIDLKRGRDVQLLETSVETLQTNLKAAKDRHNEASAKAGVYTKNKKEIPTALQEDVARSAADQAKIERQIADKRKEIQATNDYYEGLKQRFRELKGPAPKNAAREGQEPKK